MRYRQLGRTGLFVSEICLGTMTFAGRGDMWSKIGRVDQRAATALVERALAAGVNFIDTADVYSEGESERYLGVALRELGVPREDVIVATKVRGRAGAGTNAIGLSRAHVYDAAAASLKRLGLGHIDLYQIHGIDLLTPLDETMRALDDLVRRGLVRYVGCSNLAAWQVMKAQGIAMAGGLSRFETVQAYYTVATRDVEREVVPMMRDQQMGMMVWSPLAGGLLTGKFGRGASPADTRRAVFDFPPVDRERAFRIVDTMQPIAAAHGTSVARVALAWLLQRPAVMSVIVGAKTIEQLDDNLAASGLSLEPQQVAAIDEASALAAEYPQWMIERQNSDPRGGVVR
jgi:aryl-alcohol dehydrogenase-like predicted oxidoreductase